MTTANTQVIAKAAAVVAGLGLILSSFAAFIPAHAQTTTTTTTTTSSSVTFSRDLTIGSSGADVTALQAWLISKGFSIPAGATGYFGMQTKAAVAAFQAANHITPAAGYFGPITRASVNSMAGGSTGSTGGSTGSTGGTSTGGLSGGEATIRNFDLIAGEDLAAGNTNTEIALARFNVRGGDIRVQRVTVEVTPSGTGSSNPWKYIDTLSVYNGSKKVGSIDVSTKSDWDKSGSVYSVDIPVDTIVRQGDNQELSIRANAVNTIDTADINKVLAIDVPDNGMRAVDSAGIQVYTGKTTDTVNLRFTAEQNGDLNVRQSTNNPSAQVMTTSRTQVSDSYDVLAFQLHNKDNVDVDLNTITFDVAHSGTSTTANLVRRATLDLGGDTYTGTITPGFTSATSTIVFDNLSTSVSANSNLDATLSVTLFAQQGRYNTTGESLTFSLAGSKVSAESADKGNTSTVSGSVAGNTMTVGGENGLQIAHNNNSASETYNTNNVGSSTATFTLKFDVTANGDDVYVPRTASTDTASTTAGVVLDTSMGSGGAAPNGTPANLSSSAQTLGGFYVVHGGQTETFTAQVTFDPAAAGYYQVGLDKIHFNDSASLTGIQTLDVDQTRSENQTNSLYVH